MVDYYALPKDWPGRDVPSQWKTTQKVEAVQNGMLNEVSEIMGDDFDRRRFVPYVMMHEFEAMLFSDCDSFGRSIGFDALIPDLQTIRDQFPNPEDIDDSKVTAPSKRIEKLIKEYEKPIMGNVAILEIGLESIRSECPNFSTWLNQLEDLPDNGSC